MSPDVVSDLFENNLFMILAYVVINLLLKKSRIWLSIQPAEKCKHVGNNTFAYDKIQWNAYEFLEPKNLQKLRIKY